ncbi:hypothetical protein [Agromyces flavus]|uniref:hypothetical protein n=1 Tax=Agromyces flavus TaxID=589382 RepID=UPI003618D897
MSSLHHVILDEMDIRLVLLEWGDGGNIALEITNTREQHNAEEFRSLVQPIVDSLCVRAPARRSVFHDDRERIPSTPFAPTVRPGVAMRPARRAPTPLRKVV